MNTKRSINSCLPLQFTLLLIIVFGSDSWAETVTPTHLMVQATSVPHAQLDKLEPTALPVVLVEQDGMDYYHMMMSSVQSGQFYPVLGRIWFEDDRDHRVILPMEKGSPSTELGQLVRWGIEFSPTTLNSLNDGSYTLQLPLRWPQSGIDTILFNLALSGFEDAHRIELRADKDKWDITTLFVHHVRNTSIDIPVKICLDPFSVSSAELTIQDETVMTNKVGDTLPYQLQLVSDKSEQLTRYLNVVLKPEVTVQIPPLSFAGPQSRVKDPCRRYLFRLTAPEIKAAMAPGHYSQTLFLTLSQDV